MTDDQPAVPRPSRADIEAYASEFYLSPSDDRLALFEDVVGDRLRAYDRLAEFPSPDWPGPDGERDAAVVAGGDDPLNAFVTRCRIEGSSDGPLAGTEIGLKDNIAVAGVGMSCGLAVLEDYIPGHDATVVDRLLSAGGTIVGKTTMEPMGMSASGEATVHGPVRNARDPAYLAGGSSSGSGAAVAAGEVDLAIGGDQGGSIRIPAAWNGCVGHKPTHGLVPYTGVVGLGHSIDHVGPLAPTVEDCARAMDVLAGHDPLDPRQSPNQPTLDSCVAALPAAAEDVSVGVLEEGFERRNADPGVTETVRDALAQFETAGARLESVSVEWHPRGLLVWNAIVTEEATALLASEGIGHYVGGFYDTDFADAFARARREHADEFPLTLQATLLVGQHLADTAFGRYYGTAKNLVPDLSAAYDRALQGRDVLAMPTVLQPPHQVKPDRTAAETLERATNVVDNTAQFDATGHPAVTVPCGYRDGLPVGLMFVGRHFEDDTVLRVADTFERHVGAAA